MTSKNFSTVGPGIFKFKGALPHVLAQDLAGPENIQSGLGLFQLSRVETGSKPQKAALME